MNPHSHSSSINNSFLHKCPMPPSPPLRHSPRRPVPSGNSSRPRLRTTRRPRPRPPHISTRSASGSSSSPIDLTMDSEETKVASRSPSYHISTPPPSPTHRRSSTPPLPIRPRPLTPLPPPVWIPAMYNRTTPGQTPGPSTRTRAQSRQTSSQPPPLRLTLPAIRRTSPPAASAPNTTPAPQYQKIGEGAYILTLG